MGVQWDVTEIIAAAGGVTALHRLLLKHNDGIAPPASTISMWPARGSIPGKWSAAVIHALVQEGHNVPVLMREVYRKNQDTEDGPLPGR